MSKTNFYIEQLKEREVEYIDKKFMPLKDYRDCVKHVIYKHFRKLSKFLLRNEEILTNLTTSAVMADWRFDGRGSIEGYRVQCVKWAIRKTMVRMYQTQKMVYFSTPVDDGTGKMTTLLSLIKNRYKGEDVELDTATIFNECGLTQKEKERVEHYYLDGMTLKQIGELEGITMEAVRKSVENGIKKLKEHREEII